MSASTNGTKIAPAHELLTSFECTKRYGEPKNESHMAVVTIAPQLAVGKLPKKVYCNIDLAPHLIMALSNIVAMNLVNEIHSWDGCFCIRAKKGGSSASLHSWGLAVDINASTNQFGKVPMLNSKVVQCFKDAGFDWGGDWLVPDGMHFQLCKNSSTIRGIKVDSTFTGEIDPALYKLPV